jgi:hypothetical protein
VSMLRDLDHLEQLYGELFSQARVLLGLLENGEEEAFNNAWEHRKQVFKELEGLHRRLAPTFSKWEAEGSGLGAEKDEQAQKVFNEIRRLGRQVLDIDRKAAELLTARRDNLVHDLGRIKKGQQARYAYKGGSRRWWGPDKLSRTG